MTRTFLLRGAWLMLGAAIGLAAALLAGTVVGTLARGAAADGLARPTVVGGVVGAVAVACCVGLLPGVREIQVTAARTLLRVPAPLVVPDPMLARHRWGTMGWTVVQTAAGLVSGFCVFGLIPGGFLTLLWTALGREHLLTTIGWNQPAWQLVLIGVALLIGAVVGVLACGWAAVRLAPLLLGPSATDRLALAESRLADERRHTALARELHDGIGHALSIISIQAAAAQRVAGTRPEQAGAALEVIAQTSRDAQDELDHLLGLLRDPDATPARGTTPTASEEGLSDLLAQHRDAGLAIEVHDTRGDLPQLVWRVTLDILAEALTNAHRHGAGPVVVTLEQSTDTLELHVANPIPDRRRITRTGRGITGMQERAALLDGVVTAGPSNHGATWEWLVVATLPVPPGPATRTERP
ncbi:sensor histidine kinase [Ruania alba]|uniref:histidine kinase n=1 Tax=Ruania alba TaxID=648782 RepID=A0A1H5G2C5_9MICO|nr:histidine kinase [Ruania alba]SEE09892.1 Signal transduction histidine kinase [Ruania alba]